MKYFGKLAGNTNAHTALTSIPSAATGTPFTAPSPGAKLFTNGENFSHDAVSRALSALAANNDYVASLLDSPVLRDDFLEPQQTDGGADQFGFEALAGVTQGATAINLGDASGGIDAAAVWLYHGLFAEQLSECIRLVRQDADGVTEIREPVDVRFNTGGGGASSVFRTIATTGSPTRRYPKACAPMRRVGSDLPPYLGNSDNGIVAASSWDYDGVRLKAATFASRYARPGCYVEAANGGNAGLYRIAYVMPSEDTGAAGTGDKAVLTRGGLHKVTVGDGTQFTAGDRVEWQTPPNQAAASTADERDNFAYCVYIVGNDLWLLPASSSEEFLVDGKAVGVNNDSGDFTGSLQSGQVGLWDQESGVVENHGLLNGTRLYSQATTNSLISAVEHAGSPVRFDPNQAAGNVYIVSPPGFALSPELIYTYGDLIGGDYGVDCRTLSTFRERLQSQGMSAAPGLSEDPSTRLGLSRSEQVRLRTWMKDAKVGNQAAATSLVGGVNTSMAPTARVLGEDLWKVTVTNDDGALLLEAAGATAGANLGLYNRDEPSAPITRALIVSVAGNVMVLQRVRKTFGSASEWAPEDDWSSAPIVVGGHVGEGSGFSAGGDTFRVTSIEHAPILDDDVGADRFLSGGLNDSYWNLLDRDQYSRYQGAGRFIEMHASRPLTLLLPSGAGVKEGIELRQQGGGVDAITIRDRDAAAVINALFGTHETNDEAYIGALNRTLGLTNEARALQARLHWTNTGSSAGFGFSDGHTGLGNKIPFSSADHNVLPLQVKSILAGTTQGLTGALQGAGSSQRMLGDGLIGPSDPIGFPMSTAGLSLGLAVKSAFNFTITEADDKIKRHDAGDLENGVPLANGDVIAVQRASGTWYFSAVSSVGAADAVLDAGMDEDLTDVVGYVVTNPFKAAIGACLVYVHGAAYAVAEVAVDITPSAVEYLVWTETTRTVTAEADVSGQVLSSGGRVILAKVTTDATSITQIAAYTQPLSRLDQRIDITVGSFTGAGALDAAYHNERAAFPTIGEALRMIELIQVDATGSSAVGNFAWRIRVVGSTTEASDGNKGVTVPLAIPVDNIAIVGGGPVGSLTAARPRITWSADDSALFDLNGKGGLEFKGLDFIWGGTAAAAATPAEPTASVFDASSGSLYGLSVEDCVLTGGGAFATLRNLTVGGRIRFRDCQGTALTGAGIIVEGAGGVDIEDVLVERCRFLASGTDNNTNNLHGVKIKFAESAVVRDCILEGFADASIFLEDLQQHGVVSGATVLDALGHGIQVDDALATASVHISDCLIHIDRTTPDAAVMGVKTDPTGVVVVSNVVVRDARFVGISLNGAGSRAVGCVVQASADMGFQAIGDNIHFTGCTVVVADGTGFYLASADTSVKDCDVGVCGGSGIDLAGANGSMVVGCRVADEIQVTSGDNISVYNNICTTVDINGGIGHRVQGNTMTGDITVGGAGGAHSISDNHCANVLYTGGNSSFIRNNETSGIVINTGDKNTLMGNTTLGGLISISTDGNLIVHNCLVYDGAGPSATATVDLSGATNDNVVQFNIVDTAVTDAGTNPDIGNNIVV